MIRIKYLDPNFPPGSKPRLFKNIFDFKEVDLTGPPSRQSFVKGTTVGSTESIVRDLFLFILHVSMTVQKEQCCFYIIISWPSLFLNRIEVGRSIFVTKPKVLEESTVLFVLLGNFSSIIEIPFTRYVYYVRKSLDEEVLL